MLDEKIDILFTSVEGVVLRGFSSPEESALSKWCWGVGPTQEVLFGVSVPASRLILKLIVPVAGTEVRVSWCERELFRLITTAEGQAIRRAVDLSESGAGGALKFKSSKVNFGENRFSGDNRVLSLSFEALEIERLPRGVYEASMGAPSKTFCVVPFVQAFLSEDGRFYPCVESAEHSSEFDVNASPQVSDKESLVSEWNGEAMKSLRTDMLQGRVPSSCRRCFRKEEVGAFSLRKMLNEQYMAIAQDRVKKFEGGEALVPAVLDIRLQNLCNLKCRMCFPIYSSGLRQDWERIYGEKFNPPKFLNWSRDFSRLYGFFDLLPKALHVAGGEPFIIPEFRRLLNALVQDGRSREIALTINSNCTVLNDEVLGLFKHFRGVNLIVSIDGYGQINELIRYPSKFEVLNGNLRRLYSERSALGITTIKFNTTVQAYNVEHLPELFMYLRAAFSGVDWFPALNILSVPEPLSIFALNPGSRERAISALSIFLSKHREGLPERAASEIGGVIESLRRPPNPHLWDEFCRYDAILSESRAD